MDEQQVKAITKYSRLFTICVCTALSSCDPYGGYEYHIDNNSDSTLTVIYRETNTDSIKSKTIAKSGSILISKYPTIDGIYDKKENFLDRFDSLIIVYGTINKIKIRKEYKTRDNWHYRQDATQSIGNKSGDNIYTLIISNGDL